MKNILVFLEIPTPIPKMSNIIYFIVIQRLNLQDTFLVYNIADITIFHRIKNV